MSRLEKASPLGAVLMRLPLLLLLGTGCAAPWADLGPPLVPQGLDPSDYAGSSAVVLEDSRHLELKVRRLAEREHLVAVETHRRRIHILAEAGLVWAKVRLATDAYRRITRVTGRSIQPGGAVETMPWTDVARLTGSRSNSPGGMIEFTIPGAQAGCVVEYKYERVVTDPSLLPTYILGDYLPVRWSEFVVTAPSTVRYEAQVGSGAVVREVRWVRRSLSEGRSQRRLVRENIPAFFPEPAMPHLGWTAPWITLVLTEATLGQDVFEIQSWNHAAQRASLLLNHYEVSPIPGTAAQLVELLVRTWRDNGVVGLGGLPAQVWGASEISSTQRSVSNRDAAAYLLAALRARGFRAHPVLVTSAYGPPKLPDLPGLYPFIRVLVAIDAYQTSVHDFDCDVSDAVAPPACLVPEHGFILVDPVCATCRFGEFSADFRGGEGLLLSGEEARWISIPYALAAQNRLNMERDWKVGRDMRWHGEVAATFRGEPARKNREFLLSKTGSEQDFARVQAALEASIGKVTSDFETVGVSHLKAFYRPLEMRGKLQPIASEKVEDHFRFSMHSLLGSTGFEEFRRLRKYPRLMGGPSTYETRATVSLESGVRVDTIPVDFSIRSDWMTAERSCWRDELRIQCRRSITIHRGVILPQDWPKLRKVLDALHADAQGYLRLHRERRPAKQTRHGSGRGS